MGRKQAFDEFSKARLRFCRRFGNFRRPNALTILDDRFDYGEIRYITFGLLIGRVVAVAHTEDDQIIRIIFSKKSRKR